METLSATPLERVAQVSHVVTSIVDRITGDRTRYPLLVAFAGQRVLNHLGMPAQLIFGNQAWIEVQEDRTIWAGCFGDHMSFWLETAFHEIVDLGRKSNGPPLLWSREIPAFYKFRAQGVAQLDEPTDPRDRELLHTVRTEIDRICASPFEPHWMPQEPLVGPDRQMLDNPKEEFKIYDRALGVFGIPPFSW